MEFGRVNYMINFLFQGVDRQIFNSGKDGLIIVLRKTFTCNANIHFTHKVFSIND